MFCFCFQRSNSEIKIVPKFGGELEECLHQHDCLSNGTLNFLNCLQLNCQTLNFNDSSVDGSLSNCLSNAILGKSDRRKRSLVIKLGVRRGDIEFLDVTTPSGNTSYRITNFTSILYTRVCHTFLVEGKFGTKKL